ncbi:GNAT family N-acetyltransferase [Ferrimonas balearica]|uniref:GNAT family N-acetyltransferase n=1 Tax=Ferrimonas balearica TaxID=44012 RepID=UPI001C9950BD|nr:GNAT family N-acetyltransferase [Ferrimonas balearica]MBY5990645.1 GNAT family N-acetyltransferase [Ferrimonas balearica]
MELANELPPQPHIAYLETEHLRVAASVLLTAYKDDPFFRSVLPAEDYEQRLRAALREELQALWQGEQRLPGLFLGETLVGVAALLDDGYPQGQTRYWNWRLKMALGAGWTSARQWMAREEEIRDMAPAQPHWLLPFIAIAPNYQGKGYGRLLIEAICREAGLSGQSVAAYVYQGPHLALFKSQGFETIGKILSSGVEGQLMHWQKP